MKFEICNSHWWNVEILQCLILYQFKTTNFFNCYVDSTQHAKHICMWKDLKKSLPYVACLVDANYCFLSMVMELPRQVKRLVEKRDFRRLIGTGEESNHTLILSKSYIARGSSFCQFIVYLQSISLAKTSSSLTSLRSAFALRSRLTQLSAANQPRIKIIISMLAADAAIAIFRPEPGCRTPRR